MQIFRRRKSLTRRILAGFACIILLVCATKTPILTWRRRRSVFPCASFNRPTRVNWTVYGRWQVSSTEQHEVIVYSAFYDNRVAAGQPAVRVLGLATTSQLYCHIWSQNAQGANATVAIVQKNGRGFEDSDRFYGQYLITCPLFDEDGAGSTKPQNVSITASPCEISTNFLEIIYPEDASWKLEFGVCVAISHGNIDAIKLVEWMELHKLLGVSEIHIYNGTIDANVTLENVFRVYQQEKFLTIHQLPPPKEVWTAFGAKMGSPVSLNDCMLRYMYRYRYIIVIDFDEVIVPRSAENYHAMLQQAKVFHNLREDPAVYTFRNTYFFLDFSPDKSMSSRLHFLRYRNRTKPSDPLFAPKSIVDPRRCISVFNHWCHIAMPRDREWFAVDPSVGLSHHYKMCQFGPKECKEMMANRNQDDVLLPLKDKLTFQIEQKLHLLGL